MTDVLLAAKARNGVAASLDEYRAAGGYQAVDRALKDMKPADLIPMIKDSGLRGRGGAGFPSGLKWSFVPSGDKHDGGPKYLVCNFDEMEPGTFKDRVIAENNPHVLIEGHDSCRLGDGDDRRVHLHSPRVLPAGESTRDRDRRSASCRIPGRRCRRHTVVVRHPVHRSGGRYICGEETALLNAFEGRRRSAARQAAVPGDQGPVGPADYGAQRGDARVRSRNRPQRCRVVQGSGQESRGRGHQALRRLAARSSARCASSGRSAPRCAS